MRTGLPHGDERGFILVGVVTFMLALTILGLSLFALSSYEAQFFGASATREQALQNCESGMGLVQALLESHFPRNLENARLAVGQFGITSAIAYQPRNTDELDTLSTGPVDWDKPVFIEVKARSGDAARSLYAKYTPMANANPYQRLIAANTGISYNNENSPRRSSFRMSGRVWQYVQSSADTAWTNDVTWLSGRPVDPSQPPIPLADAFVDEKMAGLLNEPSGSYSEASESNEYRPSYSFQFLNSTSLPRFFTSPELSPDDVDTPQETEFQQYSFFCYPSVNLKVRGTVVWVVPQGICFRRIVTVRADDDTKTAPTLIIVAKANRRDPGYENRGIWFQGALRLVRNDEGVTPRVYLVSQGDIGVTHRHSASYDYVKEAEYVSIVSGGGVEIGGPRDEDVFRLEYDTSMDPLADQLLGNGALPPAAGGSATAFRLNRGHWRETTPR